MGYIGEERLKELLTQLKNKFMTSTQVDEKISTALDNNDGGYAMPSDIPTTSDTYSSTSTNPISGKGVAEALSNYRMDKLSYVKDINITDATDGDVLVYDAENDSWVNGATPSGGAGASSWSDLSDKPFDSLDSDTLSVDNGILTVIGGGTSNNITLDDTVTETSVNGVKSSGIYSAIAGVKSEILGAAPETLDTLKEIADALGNDANLATTLTTSIGQKADADDVYTKTEVDGLLENAGGGSEVSVNQTLKSGTEIGSITVDGSATKLYAPNGGSTVSVAQTLKSGTEIGSVTVNGTATKLYAPSSTNSTWANISNKPFTSLDNDSITVDKNGVLSAKNDIAICGGYEYSNAEQVVGKWINGKPVYRQIISKTFNSLTANSVVVIKTIPNIEGIWSYRGCLIGDYASGDKLIMPFPYSIYQQEKCIWYIKSTGNINFMSCNTYNFGCNVIICIEYTKTTDAENSFTIDMLSSPVVLSSDATTAEVNNVFKE